MDYDKMKRKADEMARNTRERDEAFQSFLELPTTKLALSLIPPGDNPDALQVALRSAFDSGYGRGMMDTIVMLIRLRGET